MRPAEVLSLDVAHRARRGEGAPLWFKVLERFGLATLFALLAFGAYHLLVRDVLADARADRAELVKTIDRLGERIDAGTAATSRLELAVRELAATSAATTSSTSRARRAQKDSR